jgi:hypothetical protein
VADFASRIISDDLTDGDAVHRRGDHGVEVFVAVDEGADEHRAA